LKTHLKKLHGMKALTCMTNFKGNKQNLPSKPCQACGREMTWRKAWAKNWDQVRYCSDGCRKNKTNKTNS
jgi:hypothetical protein